MKQSLYSILKGLLAMVGKLPFPLFYSLSTVAFYIVYYGTSYRKRVVRKNLRIAFPDKPPKALKKIEKDFYRSLCDIMLEFLKLPYLSKEEVFNRFETQKDADFYNIAANGGSAILMLGHTGNWEWAGLRLGLGYPYRVFSVYKRLRNPFFEKLVRQYRQRFGQEPVRMKMIGRKLVECRQEASVTALVADQGPHPKLSVYVNFFGVNTPFYNGPERMARHFNLPVFYASLHRTKRGKYCGVPVLITHNPREEPENRIIERYAELLEADIRQQPELWMWSHKRWKGVMSY